MPYPRSVSELTSGWSLLAAAILNKLYSSAYKLYKRAIVSVEIIVYNESYWEVIIPL